MKRDRQLIERFWALRRSVRFSSTETVLYLALVRLCRDAGWPPALLCPNAALCREAGIDESTLVRARHALIRKGVIGYAGTTAGSHRTCYVLSPLPVPDSGAALPAGERTGPSATGRDSAGLHWTDCGIPDRADSGRGAACPTPAAKRRAGIGREFAGTDRADNARSDQPVPDSGAADSPEAGMGMNANRDSAGLRIDRPDESAVGNRASNPRAKGAEAGGPDTPAFAPANSGSAPATPPIQPCPCGKPQNPGTTAQQKGGAKAAQRCIGAGTEAHHAPETGPTGMENSGPRSRRRAVTPPQAGKGAGKEGDYGGDREEERDYPSNGIDHKSRNGWETYRPGNGDVAGEEARAAILPDILPDLRAGNRHEQRSDTSLETRPDSGADVRPNIRQDTNPETQLDARPDSQVVVRPNTRQDIDPDTPLDARPDPRADVRPDTQQDTDPETLLDARPNSQADVQPATPHDSPLDGRATRRLKTGTNNAQPATAPAIRSGEDTACCSEQADGRVSASGKGAVRKRVSAPAVPAKGIPSSHPAQTAAAATAECGNPMEETDGRAARTEQGIAEQKRPEYRAAADGDEELSSDRPTAGTTGSTAKRIPHRYADAKATLRGTAAAEEATGCGTVRADDIPVWCAVEEATRSDSGAARSGIRSTQTDIRRARAGNRAPQPGNPAACTAGMTVRSAGAGRESVAQADREPTQADWEPTQAAPAVGVAEVPTKRRRRLRAELDLSFVGQDFLTPFGEWLAYKRGRGNGYRTQASLEACYERLLRLSDGDPARAREVVRQSIANNWSGIFELRQNHANHYPIAPAHAGAVPRTAVPPHTDGYTDTL
ncbi:hypothetical protein [Alistipes sp.]|uniref:hypothetical protein n=1 Tax=Alistipes sp. TaxID=1872444 RepID=UPI003AB3D7B3